MPFVDRSTLPEDFFDVTSAELLVQPRPQYIYAQLMKLGLAASLTDGDGAASLRAPVGAMGAPMDPVDSMRLMLEDPTFMAAIKVVPELGKSPGHTVRINRPVFSSTTYTDASRTVPSGTSISTTPIALSMEQTSVTLKRFAGPYSGSAVAPIGIERFDSSLSMHSAMSYVRETLKDDLDHFMHAAINSLLENAANVVRPHGFTADSQFVSQDAAPCDLETCLSTENALREANITPFPNGQYACVLTPHQTRDLALDPLFARYAEDHPPINPVLSQSYFKTIGGLDIFRSNALTIDSTTVSGVNIQHGQAFGPGVIGAGMGSLPRVATSTVDNYGEHALLIWLMYAGWELLDDRFAASVRTT